MGLRPGIVVLFVALVVVSTPFAMGAGNYELSVAGAVDVPDRTVTVDGETFHVSSISTFEQGSALEADVAAPDDTSEYRVLLYDSERRIQKSTRTQEGDGTIEFGTDDLPPGSYVLAVDDGGFEAVHPVVVQGYDVTVDAPATVEAGEEVAVTVDLDPLEDAPAVDAVEVAHFDGDHESTVTATETSSNSYEATLTAPTDDGQYRLVSIVRSPETIDGRNEREIVAIGGPSDVQVQSTQEPMPTSTPPTPPGTPGGNGSATPTVTEPVTGGNAGTGSGGSGSAPNADTPTGTDDTAAGDGGRSTETDGTADETPTDDRETGGNATSSGPITPADVGETPDVASPVDDQPGFGIVSTLLGLLGGTLYVRRAARTREE